MSEVNSRAPWHENRLIVALIILFLTIAVSGVTAVLTSREHGAGQWGKQHEWNRQVDKQLSQTTAEIREARIYLRSIDQRLSRIEGALGVKKE